MYDLRKDPYLIKNVATDPAYAATKTTMAAQLMKTLTDAKDPRVTGDGKTFDREPFTVLTQDPEGKAGKAGKKGKKGGADL